MIVLLHERRDYNTWLEKGDTFVLTVTKSNGVRDTILSEKIVSKTPIFIDYFCTFVFCTKQGICSGGIGGYFGTSQGIPTEILNAVPVDLLPFYTEEFKENFANSCPAEISFK